MELKLKTGRPRNRCLTAISITVTSKLTTNEFLQGKESDAIPLHTHLIQITEIKKKKGKKKKKTTPRVGIEQLELSHRAGRNATRHTYFGGKNKVWQFLIKLKKHHVTRQSHYWIFIQVKRKLIFTQKFVC